MTDEICFYTRLDASKCQCATCQMERRKESDPDLAEIRRLQAEVERLRAERKIDFRAHELVMTQWDEKLKRAEAERDRMRPVYELAKEIREGRYSIKSRLERKDRDLFDRFYEAIDAARAKEKL